MLTDIVTRNLLQARGVIGFYPANSDGDDIIVYDDPSRTHEITRFFGLRQQISRKPDVPFHCLSDFVAPLESGVHDYVGLFALSAGFGCEEACTRFREENDDFKVIMIQALADRLAEAFAEMLHERVRTEYWGYCAEENLDLQRLHSVKYQGIRPAPGYPCQPDHSEKLTLWKLLNVRDTTGIELTDSLAMWPAASICGLYFAHPQATYFSLGRITREQVQDYAARKRTAVEDILKWLGPILDTD